MKNLIVMISLFTALFLLPGYSSLQVVQATPLATDTPVAPDAETRIDSQEIEDGLKLALVKAGRGADEEKIAGSFYNLGAFYRRQNRLSAAIHYLKEALKYEEKISGPASERTGRTLAELAAAYAMEDNLFEGRPYANRLKPLAGLYTGEEAVSVAKILTIYAIDPDKYASEVAELKPLADQGDPKAQYQLATVYFNGPDTGKLLPTIFSLYEKSANQGYAEAQYYLGVIYDKGRGIKYDDQKAREWYRLAAENNHPAGQFNYSVFLLQGRGGPKNESEAWSWLRKSGEQGYPSALRILSENKN